MLHLLVEEGYCRGERFDLAPGESLIGRGEEAAIRLLDDSVSRRHARLFWTSDRLQVADLESRNGVLLNGVRVRAAQLFPGDTLRLGEIAFVVAEGERGEGVPTRPLDASPPERTREDSGDHAAATSRVPPPEAPAGAHRATVEILGKSPALVALLDALEKIAPSGAAVLVRGETGTGKELVARAIHALSPRRRTGELVALNCSSLGRDLLESELFGHERGAFKGALARKLGLVERARGGTLFLDEVGELGLDAQAKLLRLLESGDFRRVGGLDTLRANCRVIAATNRDLEDALAAGAFREDLYYRLRGVEIRVPPLRERGDDALLLARSFIERSLGRGVVLSPDAERLLLAYPFPGNVRELKNAIEHAAIFARDLRPRARARRTGASSRGAAPGLFRRGKRGGSADRDPRCARARAHPSSAPGHALEPDAGGGAPRHRPEDALEGAPRVRALMTSAGDRLGPYRLLRALGRGGMGEVFLAEDAAGKTVAVKVLYGHRDAASPGHDAASARFLREGRVLQTLDHPRIVRALSDVEAAGSCAYYAMEFVAGRDLGALLRAEGRRAPARAAAIAADLLEALAVAHARGILHRDVKPGNILLDHRERARLADFGIARIAGSGVTATGALIGTAEYLSPEVAEGREPSAAADIYAAGVVLFEMLSGRPPFTGPHPLAVLKMHAERPLPPLATTLPQGLEDLVRRALAKDPQERPDAAAVRTRLLEIVPVKLESEEDVERPTRPLSPLPAPGPEDESALPAGAAPAHAAASPRGPFSRQRPRARRALVLVGAVFVLLAAAVALRFGRSAVPGATPLRPRVRAVLRSGVVS